MILQGWKKHLALHPDLLFRQTIFDIIEYGAKIGYTGPDQFIIGQNLSSATEAPEIITMDLENQIAKDRVTKLDSLPSKFISSPLGLVPKPKGGWRRIHHLSYPKRRSVNDFIPEEWGMLEYTSVDEAMRKIRRLGRGCTLVKKDLADAYCHIPVAKSDWWALGFEWMGTFWFERFLPFGLRTSAFLFDLFAKALNWIMLQKFQDIIHYLDDFFGIFADPRVADDFNKCFNEVCQDLGVTVNIKKDLSGTLVDFLGIELDTIQMQARLPQEKLDKAKALVKKALRKPTLSYHELETLVGFLSFATKVVVPGRAFLRRLFNKLSEANGTMIHVNQEVKADLSWWSHFLPKWNGIGIIHITRPRFCLWTDASGEYGIGAYILKEGQTPYTISCEQVLSERFTTRLRPKHINVKEMTAILHALQKWLSLIKGSHLILRSDNFAVAKGVKKSSIRGNAMHALRAIAMLTALNDFEIESHWISTRHNSIADLLSRGKLQKLADKYPNLQEMI